MYVGSLTHQHQHQSQHLHLHLHPITFLPTYTYTYTPLPSSPPASPPQVPTDFSKGASRALLGGPPRLRFTNAKGERDLVFLIAQVPYDHANPTHLGIH